MSDRGRERVPTEAEIIRRWMPGCLSGLGLLVIAVVLMNLRPWTMPLYADDAKTLAEVRRRVELGSAVSDAQHTMERNGFKCRIERGLVVAGPITQDRLYCSQNRAINRWRFPLFDYTWRVWFILDGDTVTEIGMVSAVDAL